MIKKGKKTWLQSVVILTAVASPCELPPLQRDQHGLLAELQTWTNNTHNSRNNLYWYMNSHNSLYWQMNKVTTICTDTWTKSIYSDARTFIMVCFWQYIWAQKLAQSKLLRFWCIYVKMVLEDYVCCCVVYLDSWSCFQFMLQLEARFLLQVKYILTSIILKGVRCLSSFLFLFY